MSHSHFGTTGVNWAARDPIRMSRELVNGAGPHPVTDANKAWVDMAKVMAETETDFQSVMKRIQEHWEGPGVDVAQQKMFRFLEWLQQSGQEALSNAKKTEAQGAAYDNAVLEMPHESVLAKQNVESSLAALGTGHDVMKKIHDTMQKVATHHDLNRHEGLQKPAKVMREYEHFSEQCMVPWTSTRPPFMVPGDALNAEEKAKEKDKDGKDGAGGGSGGGGGGGEGVGTPPPPLTAPPTGQALSSSHVRKSSGATFSRGGSSMQMPMSRMGYPMGMMGGQQESAGSQTRAQQKQQQGKPGEKKDDLVSYLADALAEHEQNAWGGDAKSFGTTSGEIGSFGDEQLAAPSVLGEAEDA